MNRAPAVAGSFYPADAATLSHMLNGFLEHAASGTQAPKAIIAPHAGYIYSGPIAASAYARLKPVRDSISRVVLLGPSHRVARPTVQAAGRRTRPSAKCASKTWRRTCPRVNTPAR